MCSGGVAFGWGLDYGVGGANVVVCIECSFNGLCQEVVRLLKAI